jgi:hypothetical protein
MPSPKKSTKKEVAVAISAPRIKAVQVKLKGNAPYMQSRFSQKAMQAMMSKMDGSTKQGAKKVREARNFDDDYHQAMHKSIEGWIGIPASSIRAAAISACRLTGFTMTRAKLSIFVKAQGFDKVDGQPLVRIYGEPERNEAAVRNATGVFDIRVRPLWREWYALPVIKFDEDQFSLEDMLNLLRRVGLQVGLGEGRPDSRASAGLGFGTFDVESPSPSDGKEPAKKVSKVKK